MDESTESKMYREGRHRPREFDGLGGDCSFVDAFAETLSYLDAGRRDPRLSAWHSLTEESLLVLIGHLRGIEVPEQDMRISHMAKMTPPPWSAASNTSESFIRPRPKWKSHVSEKWRIKQQFSLRAVRTSPLVLMSLTR